MRERQRWQELGLDLPGTLYSREGAAAAQQLSALTCDEVKEPFLGNHGKALLLSYLLIWVTASGVMQKNCRGK